METVKEIKIDGNNNESQIAKGVYKMESGSYLWVTYSRSGECKRLSTAMKKAGLSA